VCGIAGFALRPDSKVQVGREVLVGMSRALVHRGPDDEGFYFAQSVGLASRRLSIIDLSQAGRMPLFNETGTVAVVQNGEIYNYRDLREQLVKKGHIFRSTSDTEVIVHLYEEEGENFVAKLEGMFAIALWDNSKKKLFLARDRFGEKPLYVFEAADAIVFASELRSLCVFPGFTGELDWDALDQFLTLGYILAPRSPYLRTTKVLPGHYLVFQQESGLVHCRPYWSAPSLREPENAKSEADYLDEFEKLFWRIVESRLISDVPVGAFLSGGIDSSLVVAAMSRIKKGPVRTFSIGFENSHSHDENPVAESVAKSLGTEHQSVQVRFQDFKSLMDHWPDLCDEPLGDSAYVGVYLISKFAKETGITVMVSGDGGDELFLGYSIFDWVANLAAAFDFTPLQRRIAVNALGMASRVTGNSRLEKGRCALQQPGLADAMYYLTGYGAWSVQELRRLKKMPNLSIRNESFVSAFGNGNDERSLEDRISRALILTYLPDNNLARMDRASMANSIETRTPFLHPELAEFAARLPMRLKRRGSVRKLILRKALAQYVPADVWLRPKSGFNALPIGQWMKEDLNFLTDDYLNADFITRQGIFDGDVIAELMAQHRKGGRFNHWWKLWLFLILQMWLQRWGRAATDALPSTDRGLPACAFEAAT
jgi:asparagine synthase (glutamine-hydrolysing)